ncbi:MAG: pseudouridine-5'-phosphate glycosidase [Rhodobacteraceae bacterium]|nr:pseudouridine-5'-phosphate glycosidase [Paracoccaceae bacterium]
MTIRLSAEVGKAIDEGGPVVGLETSIIANGLPYPVNIETAMDMEAVIRQEGAIPATIGLINGAIKIGLDAAELSTFAARNDVMKVGAAEIPFALVRSCMGATTVAATLACADRVGIGVVATGGIGGIHHGWHQSHDESHDLRAIARTRAILVASGAKAILDIPRTLERLETLGVAVIAFGQDAFPAFWSRESGINAPMRLDTVEEIVRFSAIQRESVGSGGLLVANPVPENMEIPRATVAEWIGRALAEAEAESITGKAVTPYLLDRIRTLSNGQSVATNRCLAVANSALAARIAAGLAMN